jgi:hypothetical protein
MPKQISTGGRKMKAAKCGGSMDKYAKGGSVVKTSCSPKKYAKGGAVKKGKSGCVVRNAC